MISSFFVSWPHSDCALGRTMAENPRFGQGFYLEQPDNLDGALRRFKLGASIASRFMDKAKATTGITSFSHEHRVFPPPQEFARKAHIKSLAEYRKLYAESIRSPEKFWARQAKQELAWFKPWT